MDSHQIDALALALAEKLSPKSSVYFDDLCAAYLADRRHLRSYRMDESRARNYLLPEFKGKLLWEVTPQSISELHKKIGEKYPYQANRVLQQLSQMFKLAKLWQMIPRHGDNPVQGISLFDEFDRERFLEEEEIKRLVEPISQCRKLHYRILFWIFLLTALRHDELVCAKWSDIDWENWTFRLAAPRSKNKRSLYLPLPAEALALFSRLPRRGAFIFSVDGTRPLNQTSVWKAWNRIRRKAGLADVCVHDLRRTVGSWLSQSGEPLPLIADVLNHADLKSTMVYSRMHKPHVRVALQKHASRIAKFISDV